MSVLAIIARNTVDVAPSSACARRATRAKRIIEALEDRARRFFCWEVALGDRRVASWSDAWRLTTNRWTRTVRRKNHCCIVFHAFDHPCTFLVACYSAKPPRALPIKITNSQGMLSDTRLQHADDSLMFKILVQPEPVYIYSPPHARPRNQTRVPGDCLLGSWCPHCKPANNTCYEKVGLLCPESSSIPDSTACPNYSIYIQ